MWVGVADDLLYLNKCGRGRPHVYANFITTSLEQAGIDPNDLSSHGELNINDELGEALRESNDSKPWRDIWSAGHGVGAVEDIPHVADLVERMINDYHGATLAQMERAQSYKRS